MSFEKDGVRVYNPANSILIAVLTLDTKISKEVSKPCVITVRIPNIDRILDETYTEGAVTRYIIDIGNVLRVYRSGNLDAVGYIVGPLNKVNNPVVITAIGLSSKLERYRLPSKLDMLDEPAEVLRALLKEYTFRRLTTVSDFNAGTYSNTELIELGTEGTDRGAVTLDQISVDPVEYETSGYWESAVIDMGELVTAWRRIKFKAGFGEFQTLTFTTNTSVDNIVWEGWVALTNIDEWCEDGYPIVSAVGQYIKIRIHFATDDSKISPIVEAIEVQGTLGSIFTEGTGFNTLPTEYISYNTSYANHLNAISTVVDEQEFEWEETTDGKINVFKVIGTDLTDRYGLHEHTHFQMLDYEEDDADLVNYVIALGTGVGLDQLTALSQDPDSIAKYGKRVGIYENVMQKTGSDLADAAFEYLTEYKNPKRFVRLRVIDTPDGQWDFEPGDTIRILSERCYGGTVIDDDFRIYKVVRLNGAEGYEVELTLTNPHPRSKSFIEEYLREQQEFALAADSAVKNIDMGDIWTAWINADDTLWHSFTTQLGFTPTEGHVVALQILEDVTLYYSQPEGDIDYRIKDLRTGEMEVEYRRTASGTNRIKIHFLWKAWSRRRTFSSTGLGGQIA